MAERPDQIEQHIASTRHELGNNLHELEDKVKQAADWRTYYERSPMTMVGLAFGGGVLVAAMMGGKIMGGKREPEITSFREAAGTPFVGQTPRTAGYLTAAPQKGPIFDTWQNLKAALIGLSGAKIRTLLDQALPGFSEHYDNAARGTSGYSATSYPQSREHEVPSHRM